MAVFCDRARLVYFPVPKVACTSLKALFWEINHGRPRPEKLPLLARLRRKLGGSVKGETLQTEPGYRTTDFDPDIEIPPGYECIAVVRDPLVRLHSAWSNKVNRELFERHGELDKLKEHQLSDSPSFAEFIDRFDDYRAVSVPVRRHTSNFAKYLGEDINWFSQVFRVENIEELAEFLNSRLDMRIRIPLRNQGRPDRRSNRLRREQRDRVERILAGDYRLLSNYYRLDESIDRFL